MAAAAGFAAELLLLPFELPADELLPEPLESLDLVVELDSLAAAGLLESVDGDESDLSEPDLSEPDTALTAPARESVR